MVNKIRILLADDQVIVREGIQRIVERERDMEVVGDVWTAAEVLPKVRATNPDVVLLDLRWHRDDQAMNQVITRLRREYPKAAIIGLTAYEYLLQQAKAAGAMWAVTKDISKDELVRLIRAASKAVEPGELEEASSTLAHLRDLETGTQFATIYEESVCAILEAVLYPHLTAPRLQANTMSGSHRRDILFANFSSHPFWQRMSQRHDATVVVFEAKNVKRLYARYVDQVSGYLAPALGRLGFIVARSSAGKSMLRRAVEVFRNDGKVVLFLSDDDLEEMLKLKERGDEPTKLIWQRYENFIIQV